MGKRAFYGQRRVAEDYDRLRWGGQGGEWVNRRGLEIVRSLLPARGKVLDLGCGTGRLSLYLDTLGYEVVALDSSAEMLAVARAKAGADRITWLQGDALALPLSPASFDAVVALRLAFHFAALRPFLKAAATAVKPGGTIALDTCNWSPRALAALGKRTWGPRVFIHRPGTVMREAEALGLEVAARKECFLFSLYIYNLLPPPIVRGLERLEQVFPGGLKARVFWGLRSPG